MDCRSAGYPRVNVCVTSSCFQRLVPNIGYSAASCRGICCFLSPNLFGRESARLRAVLTHELSHLHLGQRLGHYTPWLPIWFHEGLATLAADGGGAEFASDGEAIGAWNEGRQVDFSRLDVPGKRHRAGDFGLSIHEFYRQSWRFVEYLRIRDADAFAAMMRAHPGRCGHHNFRGRRLQCRAGTWCGISSASRYADSGARRMADDDFLLPVRKCEIEVGKPFPFAVYDADRNLLLIGG